MPRNTARCVLSEIIEPRVEEIFAVVRKRIEDTGLLEQMSAGVVLTGGAVLLEGMTEFAEEILGMPVRVGFPTGVRGITQLVHGPQYSTGVGLVKYGAHAVSDGLVPAPPPQMRTQHTSGIVEIAPRVDKSKFWEWIKAAF